MNKLIFKGCFFFLIILLHVTEAKSIFNSAASANINKVPADRIWAQTLEGSYFNEFWNYQFYFDNGIKLHIVFSAANFGRLKSPVTGVRASVFYPDGTIYQVSREYPIERLIQDKKAHKFSLRPDREIFFSGKLPDEHRVVVKTSKDGVNYDIDINFNNIVNGYMWGDGNFKLKNETVGIVTHIPYAEVSGYISINNKRSHVRGTAYMDHTHQYQTTTRLMDSGYRFIHHTDRNNWDLIYTLKAGSLGTEPVGYLLSCENGEVSLQLVKNTSTLSNGKAFGKNFPRIIEVDFDGSRTLQIARTDDQERFSILSELSWFARRAALTFLGGEVVDFRGEAILTERMKKPKNGEYNFFFVE